MNTRFFIRYMNVTSLNAFYDIYFQKILNEGVPLQIKMGNVVNQEN